MCGIFGFSSLTKDTLRLAPLLAYAMEEEGKDSWGVTNGIQVWKKMGRISESWEVPELIAYGDPVIFHTRTSSVGSVKIENQHPFEFTHKNRTIIGVHNGTLSNNKELNDKYNTKFEVDSQQIFYRLSRGKPLDELKGKAVLAYFDSFYPGRIQLARVNSSRLYISKLNTDKKEVVFCSTNNGLKKALGLANLEGQLYSELSNTVYSIRDGSIFNTGKKLNFAITPAPAPRRASWGGTWNELQWQRNGRPLTSAEYKCNGGGYYNNGHFYDTIADEDDILTSLEGEYPEVVDPMPLSKIDHAASVKYYCKACKNYTVTACDVLLCDSCIERYFEESETSLDILQEGTLTPQTAIGYYN